MKLILPAALALALLGAGCTITPLPMTETELANFAENNRQNVVSAAQEPVNGPITLYEAMARALKYNLDHKVEMMNELVARKNLRLRNAAMLPKLVTNVGYADRNNSTASYSYNIETRRKSLQATYSREKDTIAGDTTFSWHILDFGLSYVRAKQASDEVLVAEERKRRIVNKIIEDVRVAYWRAVSAERLLSGFRTLRGRVQHALKGSKKLYAARMTSPIAALSYQRELVDIKRQIERLERELHTSKFQLAALMNIRPDSKFSLHVPKRRLTDLAIKASGEDMIALALQNRPELRELAYRGRINKEEANAALLEMLPGISVYSGLNFDTNDLLYNASWVTWGAKMGWNAMKLFQYPAREASVEAEQKLLREKALATTMAVMTQVHVARARYHYLRRSAATAGEYYEIQRKLARQVRNSAAVDVASEQTLIREEMNTLLAAVQYDLAYADLQNAFAAIYVSVGIDPIDGAMLSDEMGVDELAAVLKETWNRRGDRHL